MPILVFSPGANFGHHPLVEEERIISKFTPGLNIKIDIVQKVYE